MQSAVAAMAGLLLAGCGIQPTGPVLGGPAVSVPGRAEAVQVCFLQDGELVPTARGDVVLEGTLVAPELPDAVGSVDLGPPADLRKIGYLLALGPSQDEQESGITSEVPATLRLDLPGARDAVALADGPDADESLEVWIVEPFNGITEVAVSQVECTLEMYLDQISEDREIVILNAFEWPRLVVPDATPERDSP
jgi:hypothetical protein